MQWYLGGERLPARPKASMADFAHLYVDWRSGSRQSKQLKSINEKLNQSSELSKAQLKVDLVKLDLMAGDFALKVAHQQEMEESQRRIIREMRSQNDLIKRSNFIQSQIQEGIEELNVHNRSTLKTDTEQRKARLLIDTMGREMKDISSSMEEFPEWGLMMLLSLDDRLIEFGVKSEMFAGSFDDLRHYGLFVAEFESSVRTAIESNEKKDGTNGFKMLQNAVLSLPSTMETLNEVAVVCSGLLDELKEPNKQSEAISTRIISLEERKAENNQSLKSHEDCLSNLDSRLSENKQLIKLDGVTMRELKLGDYDSEAVIRRASDVVYEEPAKQSDANKDESETDANQTTIRDKETIGFLDRMEEAGKRRKEENLRSLKENLIGMYDGLTGMYGVMRGSTPAISQERPSDSELPGESDAYSEEEIRVARKSLKSKNSPLKRNRRRIKKGYNRLSKINTDLSTQIEQAKIEESRLEDILSELRQRLSLQVELLQDKDSEAKNLLEIIGAMTPKLHTQSSRL